jgi:hypothetical protein
VDRLQRLAAWMARGSVAVSIFAAIIIVLTIAEFARPRQGVPSPTGVAPSGPGGVLIPLRPGPEIRIGHPLGGQVHVITDKSEKPTSQLLSVSMAGNYVTISPLTGRATGALKRPVRLRTGFKSSVVQVSVTGRVSRRVVFAIRRRRNRILIEEHDLGRRGRLLARFVSSAVSRPIAAQRDLRIGTWSGTQPDLFVIDRHLPDGTMRVRILSGESRFREQLLNVAVRAGTGFPRSQWSVDVGRVGNGRPDIILVTHYSDTGSGSTEVHVLSGDTNYSQFSLHLRSVLSATTKGRSMVFGYRNGKPTWFSIIEATGSVQPFELPPTSRRND